VLTLRRAERTDIPRLAELHVRAWSARSRELVPVRVALANTPEERRKRWRGFLATPANVLLVLESPEGLVGFAAGGPEVGGAPEEAHVLGLFVSPDAWGQGHGRRLLRALTGELTGRGFRRGFLWVLAGNTSARRLYEQEGWSVAQGPETDARGVVRVRYAVTWVHAPA
jgi:ribosomal protein S18 acetylase RimI-like enzyme